MSNEFDITVNGPDGEYEPVWALIAYVRPGDTMAQVHEAIIEGDFELAVSDKIGLLRTVADALEAEQIWENSDED